MGNIHTSGEDYLEAILVLWNKQNGEVRSIDVARELNVTKPSVSNAMKIL
ncbi:MAG: metal-dependent transcriptional regulator, partial [Lachnospiraceae bacterium]|nr:metal-dependent transcriptional regulator [Lachnospiraceae bacterium]